MEIGNFEVLESRDPEPGAASFPVRGSVWNGKSIRKMQVVTLLSDWGTVDYYAAVVRAKLYSGMPDVRVVDISHQVPRGDINAAAFMMQNTYSYFPPGTIHIIGVEDIASKYSPHVLVRFEDQFFIGADNGFFRILQVLSGKKAQEIIEIDVWQESEVYTFPSRDLFPKVAAMVAGGEPLEKIGPPLSGFQLRMMDGGLLKRMPENDRAGVQTGIRLLGRVLYIDGFGNICTNITRSEFEACAREYPFRDIRIGRHLTASLPVMAYQDVAEGEIASVFLDNGLLEISINRGYAARLLGIDMQSKITVTFSQKK